MKDYKTNSDIIREIRSHFLFMDPNATPINLELFKHKCVIYAIENTKTHKIYIGKTTHLLNRSNHYIWAYRHPEARIDHPVVNAIREDGIENFRMYPIHMCNTREELALAEKCYVEQYLKLRPNDLYNKMIPLGVAEFHHVGRGTPASTATKIAKGKWIVCINPDTKSMYICVGMKIFGDLVGSSKDQVKNCTRRGIKHHGFYVIYLGERDRNEVLNNRKANFERFLKWRSEFSPNYKDGTHEEFFHYVDLVETMIQTRSIKCFTDLGYKCQFLTYTDNDSNALYKISEIGNYNSIISKNIVD